LISTKRTGWALSGFHPELIFIWKQNQPLTS